MKKRLLAFYGDDFTGSTDVMEALASHGIQTVLFTRIPTAEEFEPFKDYDAIGLAGTSRSQTPEWMEENLPAAFAWLKSLDAEYCHYKVCSTFDSSPKVGSIGRALEIGLKVFEQSRVMMIVGAPQLKRYTFSGHLFAAYQGKTYRIDRHPVMSRHPVTPMDESDVLKHLGRQTDITVDLIDVYDEATQISAGQKILALSKTYLPFVVGSSGVEYALVKAKQLGTIKFPSLPVVEKALVISGSVSATTERQIDFALKHGFEGVGADVIKLAIKDRSENERIIAQASKILDEGKSPLIYTAHGPSSDKGKAIDGGGHHIGRSLGQMARVLVEQHRLSRIIIAGGDSSSHALSELNTYALTTRLPLEQSPGSPLCVAHSNNPIFDGLEIALKGGQVGRDDYFTQLKSGF